MFMEQGMKPSENVHPNLCKARLFVEEVLTDRRPELFEELVARDADMNFLTAHKNQTILDVLTTILPEHSLCVENSFSLNDRVYMLLRLRAEAQDETEDTYTPSMQAPEETLMLRFKEGKIVEAMAFCFHTEDNDAQAGFGWPLRDVYA